MSYLTRYEIKQEIGSGAFATVYDGYDKKEERRVAIKRVLRKKREEGVDWSALREVKLLYEINHPNVVRLVDVFVKSNDINMVLEFCPIDLQAVIKSHVPLQAEDIKSYMQMTLRGVEACHNAWVLHRDLKPDNLLIGDDRVLKVADFGLARIFGNTSPELTSEVVTLPYRAPELLYGARLYGQAVDMWSVGCIFAELMIREPFLPGRDKLDQLGKIFYALGTPSAHDWPGHESLPGFIGFTPCAGIPLRQRFSAASEESIDLLTQLLAFDPRKRLTATKALKHAYFATGRPATKPEDLPFDLSGNGGKSGDGSSKSNGVKKQRVE